jgi:hypothetical protein
VVVLLFFVIDRTNSSLHAVFTFRVRHGALKPRGASAHWSDEHLSMRVRVRHHHRHIAREKALSENKRWADDAHIGYFPNRSGAIPSVTLLELPPSPCRRRQFTEASANRTTASTPKQPSSPAVTSCLRGGHNDNAWLSCRKQLAYFDDNSEAPAPQLASEAAFGLYWIRNGPVLHCASTHFAASNYNSCCCGECFNPTAMSRMICIRRAREGRYRHNIERYWRSDPLGVHVRPTLVVSTMGDYTGS